MKRILLLLMFAILLAVPAFAREIVETSWDSDDDDSSDWRDEGGLCKKVSCNKYCAKHNWYSIRTCDAAGDDGHGGTVPTCYPIGANCIGNCDKGCTSNCLSCEYYCARGRCLDYDYHCTRYIQATPSNFGELDIYNPSALGSVYKYDGGTWISARTPLTLNNLYLITRDSGDVSEEAYCFKLDCYPEDDAPLYASSSSVKLSSVFCPFGTHYYSDKDSKIYYCEDSSTAGRTCHWGITCTKKGWAEEGEESMSTFLGENGGGISVKGSLVNEDRLLELGRDDDYCYFGVRCTDGGYKFTKRSNVITILKEDGTTYEKTCGGDFDCYKVSLVKGYDGKDYCITKISCIDCDSNLADMRNLYSYDPYSYCTRLGSDYGGWAGTEEYCPAPGTVEDKGYYSICYYLDEGERCTDSGCNIKRDFMFGDDWKCDPEKGAILKVPCPSCVTESKLQAIPSKFDFAIQNVTAHVAFQRPVVSSCSCEAQLEARDVNSLSYCDTSLVINCTLGLNCPAGSEYHNYTDIYDHWHSAPLCNCTHPNRTLFLARNWSDGSPDTGFNIYNPSSRAIDRCMRLFGKEDCYWGGALGKKLEDFGYHLSANSGPNLVDDDVWCETYDDKGKFCKFNANSITRARFKIKTLLDLVIYEYRDDNFVPAYLTLFKRGMQYSDDDGFAESYFSLKKDDILSLRLSIRDNLTLRNFRYFLVGANCFSDDESGFKVSLAGTDLNTIS